MLAVFGKQRELPDSPLSPAGTKRRLQEHQSLTPEEEEYVSGILDSLWTSIPRRQHAYVNEHYYGGGANGVAWVESMTHQLASDGDVAVFFKGTLDNNPADMEDAEYILQEYKRSFDSGAVMEGGAVPVMEVLSQLRGPYAFIVYDRSHGRVVAARDAAGAEPLYWGTTLLSEGVLFASDRALIESECSDADAFPPGAVFVSEDFSTAGTLTPFSVDESAAAAAQQQQQQQADALCRVESSSQLHKVASSSHIEAN